MKGYVAFCPHFHQPHFQLYKTREEAFQYSYFPWLKLLQEAVELEKFYINIHFSGPFFYWLRDQKADFIEEIRSLMESKKIGIIGGLADEPFIQLSSRGDDYLYQLKKYDELCSDLIGIKAADWQGIHLVERECGELILSEISRAASVLEILPLYYLDAETFYNSHYSYPGGKSDLCYKHFGFKDSFSRTTIAHIPEEMLYFGLRDEIGGQEFFVLPIHSEYRYQLLKRQAFSPEDNIRVKAKHYLFNIKDALDKAHKLAKKYGREIEPIVVIFEDAEKFGQWSKDPEGDSKWLLEFFHLLEEEEEIQLIGIKDYFQKTGHIETYPVRSSHCYTEWENWTAKRGIRGVTLGDERLRRVISRLRLFEKKQESFEKKILTSKKLDKSNDDTLKMLTRAVLQSAERFEIIRSLLDEDRAAVYELINRIRNLLYQEDPKWASRHPCYGSAPYYDMSGLAYLELADRIMDYYLIEEEAGNKKDLHMELNDWDFDGIDEIMASNYLQTVVLDPKGGCLAYHHVLNPSIADDKQKILQLLDDDIGKVRTYNHIFKYSMPLVLTETDSELKTEFYAEGGRKERCRNSFRSALCWQNEKGEDINYGDFDKEIYTITENEIDSGTGRVKLHCSKEINIEGIGRNEIKVEKEFIIEESSLHIIIRADLLKGNRLENLFLVPEIVTSAAPSDEKYFNPHAFIGITSGEGEINWTIAKNIKEDRQIMFPKPGEVDYVFEVLNGEGLPFTNRISYKMDAEKDIYKVEVEPGVRNYYKNHVYQEQSQLGYHSSGILIRPFIPLDNGSAVWEVIISWKLDAVLTDKAYEKKIHLLGE